MHYKRWQVENRRVDPFWRPPPIKPKTRPPSSPEERFWSHVEKTETCWLWTASLQSMGYGQLYIRTIPKKMVLAHRFSYELAYGSIPDGLELDHLCRTPRCVRPDHLEAVDHKTNMERSGPAQATHCANGHPYTEANTYRYPDGGRNCRICRAEQNAAWYRAHPRGRVREHPSALE